MLVFTAVAGLVVLGCAKTASAKKVEVSKKSFFIEKVDGGKFMIMNDVFTQKRLKDGALIFVRLQKRQAYCMYQIHR